MEIMKNMNIDIFFIFGKKTKKIRKCLNSYVIKTIISLSF